MKHLTGYANLPTHSQPRKVAQLAIYVYRSRCCIDPDRPGRHSLVLTIAMHNRRPSYDLAMDETQMTGALSERPNPNKPLDKLVKWFFRGRDSTCRYFNTVHVCRTCLQCVTILVYVECVCGTQ